MRRIITTAVVAFCLAAFAWGAAAQEMKEAVDLYNGAATSFKQNPQQAVADLQKSIEICEALNSEESGKLANSARKLRKRASRPWRLPKRRRRPSAT